jgi:hypothetical protein
MNRPPCPFCGSPTDIRCDSVVYGVRWGDVLICTRFPECDSYVGVHAGTDRPKGTLADRPTREARKEAHKSFDRVWRSGEMSRTAAYRWLARQLGMDKDECHIGMMTVDDCRRVIEACRGRNQLERSR